MQGVPLAAAAAPEDDAPAAEALQGVAHVDQRVGPRRVGHDAGAREGGVRVEGAEERGRAGEVVDRLDPCAVGGPVAGGGEGVDAGGMLVVFVAPEIGVRAAVWTKGGRCWLADMLRAEYWLV